jgi:hypothetical protein
VITLAAVLFGLSVASMSLALWPREAVRWPEVVEDRTLH